MKWKPYQLRDGTYAQSTIASDAGYCVCRSNLAGSAAYRYVAFHGRTGESHFKVLGGYDSAEEAKAACEAHEAKSREVAA
jgi:hypothetical protein